MSEGKEKMMGGEIKKPRRIIVEIGSEGYPAHPYGTKKFTEDELFIGSNIRSVMRSSSEFIIADGRNLPFADNSIDELIYNNIFSDPDLQSVTILDELLKEAKRTLKSGGKIIMSNTNTPWIARNVLELKCIIVESDVLERYGFKILKYSTSKSDIAEYDGMVGYAVKRNFKPFPFAENSFQLVLEKNNFYD